MGHPEQRVGRSGQPAWRPWLDAADAFEIDIREQGVRYRWRLSYEDGRFIDEGVGLYVADCLSAASEGLDPTSRVAVKIDNVFAGDFPAVRAHLESSTVVLEIAQAMLTRSSQPRSLSS